MDNEGHPARVRKDGAYVMSGEKTYSSISLKLAADCHLVADRHAIPPHCIKRKSVA